MSEWFYSQSGQQHGPVSTAELRRLAREGALRQEDLLWQEGWKEWLPAAGVKGLFDAPVSALSSESRRPAPKAVPAASTSTRRRQLWGHD
jgi:type IV pilus assembly protein PilA